MQFSTDLPYGPRAIAEYLASGQTWRMNVSREADRAFRFDLKKADPKRWAKLDAELQRDLYRRLREKPASSSKMEDDARGEPEIVLRFPEETGIQTVCLNAPGNSLQKPIIKTAADGPRGRSVREIGRPRKTCVRYAHESLDERRGFGNTYGKPRTKQDRVNMSGGAEGRRRARNNRFTAEGDLLGAVGSSEIGDRSEPTDRLVLERAIPTIEVGRSKGRNQLRNRACLGCRNHVDIGIAAENVHLAELLELVLRLGGGGDAHGGHEENEKPEEQQQGET